jgi:hypothetical protein
MQNWIQTDISVEGALKMNVKAHLLSDPYNSGTQLIIEDKVGVWQMNSDEVFNDDWVELMKEKLDLTVTGALIFARKAGYQHPGAHIDVNPIGEELLPVSHSFNWVLEQDNNPMVWYKPWWDAEDIDESTDAANGKFPFPGQSGDGVEARDMVYQETPCELLERDSEHCLAHDRITIVRTNIPHSVDMVSDKDRWCITARCKYDRQPIWSQVYDKFSQFHSKN